MLDMRALTTDNQPMSKQIFTRIDACTYEYAGTGYRVERMANGLWDAYLPSAWGYRLWESIRHPTRASAASAISLERRRIRAEVKRALG